MSMSASMPRAAYAPDDSTPPAPKKKKLETDNDKVHAMIEMQDFDGWWEPNEQVTQIMGLANAINEPPQRSKEWVTVLVLKWLDTKMAAEKDVWELVAEKAKGWLEGQGLGVEKLMEIEREVVVYFQ